MKPFSHLLAAVALAATGVGATGASAACADSEFDYIEVDSEALGKDVRVGIYLPDGYHEDEDVRYPTLYFLHGMRGSERKWESRGIPEQLDELIESGKVGPMIVVCPNGENSMYVNWKNGEADWADFIWGDLVTSIDGTYRTIADRSGRGITGDSMGGYGALNIAFHHPDVFGSVSAHSAAIYPVDPADLPEWVLRMADRWSPVFGSPVDVENWKQNNPLHLAETLDDEALKSLAIYFDCGNTDRYGFDSSNVDLSSILDDRGIPHEFHLRDGGHGREYFEEYVSESLAFHGRAFRAGNVKASGGAAKDDTKDDDAESEPPRREF